jgi:hypothetical protein
VLQLEVARSTRDYLSAVSLGGLVAVSATSDADLAGFPAVTDTQRVVWPMNPFGQLPEGEAAGGRVTELTLLDAGNGAPVELPPQAAAASPPRVALLVSLGEFA